MRAVYSKQRLGFSGFQVDIVRHTNLLAELNHFFLFRYDDEPAKITESALRSS